jgi:anti-sigma regulatory factor (Ser/Thr protein kinase)
VATTQQTGSASNPGNHGTRTPELHLEFYSRPGYLAVIRQMIDALCGRLGFTPAESSQICLAIDEALCNIIRHGYDSSPDGRIYLSVNEWLEEGVLEFIIEDDAKQVDIDTIRSRDLDDVRPGGLGVHLISEIMDEVTYDHRPHGGMRMTIRKRLPEIENEGRKTPGADAGES